MVPAETPTQDRELRAAAGPGYAREWGLFCDYTAATAQPTLPTNVAALTGFLTTLPARPATLTRRVRAIASAHRRAGHLLTRPETGPGAIAPRAMPSGPEPGPMIAACPTRGWPAGLWGRRDAFLLALTDVLDLPHPDARAITPDDITTHIATEIADLARDDDAAAGEVLRVRGRPVPTDRDPRRCPACAVVRWLEVLGLADGLGRRTAHMHLAAAVAPTFADHHRHRPAEPGRWRTAAVLLPAIDRHGWHDDYRPMTTRAIRTRRARAAERARTDSDADNDSGGSPPAANAHAAPPARSVELDEVLAMLDDLADDADALNARIQDLLDQGPDAVPS